MTAERIPFSSLRLNGADKLDWSISDSGGDATGTMLFNGTREEQVCPRNSQRHDLQER